MKKSLLLIPLLILTGCYSSYPSRTMYSSYMGFSRYVKQTTGDSNFVRPYKDPPKLESDRIYRFEREAEEYLEGVGNDLETVEEMAKNASRKLTR